LDGVHQRLQLKNLGCLPSRIALTMSGIDSALLGTIIGPSRGARQPGELRMNSSEATIAIADEIFRLMGTGHQVQPFTSRFPGFDLASAYEVATQISERRVAGGATIVGRKIGFTNREVQRAYGISGPICNFMFDTTLSEFGHTDDTFRLGQLAEPLIEPEIALHLVHRPQPGMNDAELIRCVDWIAHGFEIVHSIYPNWKFDVPDSVAAFGLHGGYKIGTRQPIVDDPDGWERKLRSFEIRLESKSGIVRHGRGSNVLGGPIQALRFLVEEMERFPSCKPVGAGEIITTGTLTDAMPAKVGDHWRTEISGMEVPGLNLHFI
jgi:2-oxo-3-hexenedioate decarboxylase